jgi:transcriptional regulator with XRE-family HTH domain
MSRGGAFSALQWIEIGVNSLLNLCFISKISLVRRCRVMTGKRFCVCVYRNHNRFLNGNIDTIILFDGYTIGVENSKPQADPNCSKSSLNLQNIRKRRGFTQRELAEKIGLTREAIASYESGRSHILDMTLIDLSGALRVSVDEILGLKRGDAADTTINRRWSKRLEIIDSLPESIRKHILRTLDDLIKANT